VNGELQAALAANKELERRLTDLAKNKSRLELINRLLSSLSSVAGLDDMVQRILDILMQTIGACNISVIFCVNGSWQYRDVYGASCELVESDKPEAFAALAAGTPQCVLDTGSRVPGLDTGGGYLAVQNWLFPLISQERKFGVVCMEGMQLTDLGFFEELHPFFVYAGLMLDNEISSFARLADAHRRLQESEIHYRNLFDQTPDGIVLWSTPELQPVQFNTAAHTILGYTRAEFSLLTVSDLHVSGYQEEIDGIMGTLRREGAASFETVHLTKSGGSRSMFVSLKMFEVDGRQMLLAIHHDITELKDSSRTLELYRNALDNARDSIFLIDPEAGFHFVNQAACQSLGYTMPELLGLRVFDVDPLFPRDTWQDFWRELRDKGTLSIETQHRTKDGRLIPVEIGIRLFDFEGVEYNLAVARDLTERRRFERERHELEQQMLHAQKLESLGVLAGGIAHDFNNILMAILGNADLALMRVGQESPAAENLRQIELASARAADLAKQMLAYSGKGRFVVEPLNLNSLLEEMLHMLGVSISKKAVLRLNLTRPIPSVEADATQMRQILMNLVINASEAIGDKSGVIAINTGIMDCDNSYLSNVWLNENLSEGFYVYLEVSDTGCGMSKETLAKIFDPFFTTKFTGRGLGMAAVLGIIRGHKGAIKVYSEPDRGTTIKILLPACDRPAEMFNGGICEDGWQGSGLVLLVDDEETVRGVGVEMLKALGFSVLTANDGNEATRIFRDKPHISLVILDLTMPHMDGEQCFRELRRIRPDVKVVISSGYNEQEVTPRFMGKGLAGFIQKPYKLSLLKEVIKGIGGQGA
jgi:two-component system, cell cycle sensor histidine kinase and response regulator CckA